MLQTSGEKQEAAGDCTGSAHAGRMPDWLAPYKDQWLSAGKLKSMIAAEGICFGPWLDEVRPRLRRVTEPSRNGNGLTTRYLVRHVWAASRAHGLKLAPAVKAPEPDWRIETRVVTREVVVDKTAASMDIVRLLIAATEPQAKPGVYFLLGEDNGLLYVGQSKNVLSRMAGHASKPYLSVRMIHVADEKRRLEIESRLIEWFQPPLNQKGIVAA